MARKKFNTKDVSQLGSYIIIAGESGHGKTYCARTLPEDNTLIISKEAGLLTLKGTNYEVEMIENFDDLIEIYEDIVNNKITAKNIFIDSLTDILDTEVETLKAKYDKKDTFVMYDQYEAKAKWLLKSFRDLTESRKVNVFFTCLIRYEQDGKVQKPVLDFYGSKMKDKVRTYFDEVWVSKPFSDNKGKYYGLITDGTAHPLCKTRSNLNEVEQPNLEYLLNKITEE